MKPALSTLRVLCPGVDDARIRLHLERLRADYFAAFDAATVAGHVRGLARLSPDHPSEVRIERTGAGGVRCTVLAFDHPGEFPLIAGVLAGAGFGVVSGDVFTYAAAARGVGPADRRRIVDVFEGAFDSPLPFAAWAAELVRRMEETLTLVERGGTEGAARARRRVNEWVVARLAETAAASPAVLYPVQVRTGGRGGRRSVLRVDGQDTPAFLYSLSTALALHGLSIERVRIRTRRGRAEDEIEFVDRAGRPVRDRDRLDAVRLSALFTKQFTFFLDRAPDPLAALQRFEQLIQDSVGRAAGRRWRAALADPHALRRLARVLGASDYLWEDFIRLQYESLLPALHPRRTPAPERPAEERLAAELRGGRNFDDRRRRLNAFKDREIFRIDLDHLLAPDQSFDAFAARLTELAGAVVRAAAGLAFRRLAVRHGRPRTAAGIEAEWAVFGLGKFGGSALGYASDIELLFVYGDEGRTDGRRSVTNDEFFQALARDTAQLIEAKREGIFRVDLRLRPHGAAGPLACSLASFCRYYGPSGPAHAFERLALTRLRAVAGDPALGARVVRLRDEFVYESPQSVRASDVLALRARQYAEKRRGAAPDAKFSPGALVDLEYAVQMLQVRFGRDRPELRTPRMTDALAGLRSAGVIEPDEADRLAAAYAFLRRLINALRMLRGSARDLFLPPADSEEFVHLARRMDYAWRDVLAPEQQLFIDFETHTAAVRDFVSRRFGPGAIPGPPAGNVADLLLADDPPEALRREVLSRAGFSDLRRADANLRTLAGNGARRATFTRLAVLACDLLRRGPDPDMALNHWERFVAVLPDPAAHFLSLLAQPRRLELLLSVFGRSRFLAGVLIRHPEFLDRALSPEWLHRSPSQADLVRELRAASKANSDRAGWRRAIRLLRRREMLRIGMRDFCLGAGVPETTADLSTLAGAIVSAALERAWVDLGFARHSGAAGRFCVLAFGKLGGRELNYSSDLDLSGVFDDADGGGDAEACARALERMHADLSAATEEGAAFRIDLRLRPYGRAGPAAAAASAVEAYYRRSASAWEIQALLKARPVAGRRRVGQALLRRLRPVLRARRDLREVAGSVRRLREAALRAKADEAAPDATDVKNGPGGLRDIEFAVQALQLTHAAGHPRLLTGRTLDAIEALAVAGLVSPTQAAQWTEDYCFLRRVEHGLQILDDRQTHSLPAGEAPRLAFARRLPGYETSPGAFARDLEACLARTRAAFDAILPA